jgi:hypothetical protein
MNDKQNSVQNIFCRRFLAGLSTKYGVSVYMKCIHLEPLLQYRRSSATYFVVLIRLFKRIPLQSVQTEHYCAFPHPLSFKTRKLFFDFSKLHRFCPWYIVLKRPLTNQPINQPRLVLPGLLAKRPLHWTRQTWGLKHEKKKKSEPSLSRYFAICNSVSAKFGPPDPDTGTRLYRVSCGETGAYR